MIAWKEVAIGSATLLVGIVVYLYVGLETKVDDQAKQLIRISKQMDIVVSILSTKMPDVNFPALISIAVQNNIPSEKVNQAVPLLMTNPIEAKVYMRTQMKLNEQEIHLIMQPSQIIKANSFKKVQ